MAKVKFDYKNFLLQKGEKIVLGVALAGLGLFGVLGISEFVSAESPVKESEKFKTQTAQINQQLANEKGDPGVKPLDPVLMAPSSFKPIEADYFRSPYLPFEPVDHPSDKRDNPQVLGITDAQVDLVRAPIKAYEVLAIPGEQPQIGLLYDVKIGKVEIDKLKGMLQDKNKGLKGRAAQAAPAPAAPAAPVAPAPAAPPPAMPGGGGGARGGNRGGGGSGGPGMPGSQMVDPGAKRIDKSLRYVLLENLDEELKKDGVIPALSVYPMRMVVVHAAFPLKEQLEVIRRALRLKTIAEADKETATGSSHGPTFLGFEVERQITDHNGNVFPWAPYDHIGEYRSKILIRKFADQPDDGLLAYFLRYDQMMAMPLPALAANLAVYPGIRLESIIRGYNKLREANKQPETISDMQKKFKGEGAANPFAPSGGGGGAFGGDAPAVGVQAGRGDGKGPRPLPGGTPPSLPGAPVVPKDMPELEHMMIRFLDVDIHPGYTYQYRVRVRMKNPNFGNARAVARPDDAKQPELYGPWVAIANQVSVPVDHNIYAGDPIAYAERLRREFRNPKIIDVLDNKNGEQPVVQFQTWTERVPIESGKSEPAGYWVVADVPVNRGEYIGRKQLVPLPMWSSEKVAFILQELPKYSVKGSGNDKPKGLLVDFTTPDLLVDYEGGKVRQKFGDRVIEDEADVEILILKPDGTVEVRNSGIDRENIQRKFRDEAWQSWLKEIVRITNTVGQPGNGGGNDPFATPPRPGG